MPQQTPGRHRGRLGTAVPKTDLAAHLEQLSGLDLSKLSVGQEQLEEWNTCISTAIHTGFEHRVLLGLAIHQQRPSHGSKRANDATIGERLGRSARWVRETLQVSGAVSDAFEQGIVLPLEIRDMSWRRVPGAIENLRQGRRLDWKRDKVTGIASAEERATAVTKAIQALTKALDAIDSTTHRTTLAKEAMDAIAPYASTSPEPAPPEPSPAPPEPSPKPRRPHRPDRDRPRHSPGRGPRRRRR
jgi:hypothetical protein